MKDDTSTEFKSPRSPHLAGVEKIIIENQDPAVEAARLDLDELIRKYDPDDPNNAYGARLATLAKGQSCLIFDDKGLHLNVALTKKELDRLLMGYPGRATAVYDSNVYTTYPIGKRPKRYVDQNPWDGKPLNPGGYSDAGVAWGELPLRTRQLVLIASQGLATTRDSDFSKYTEVDLYERLTRSGKGDPSFAEAALRFPNAAAQFKDWEQEGHLPSMKVELVANPAPPTPTP